MQRMNPEINLGPYDLLLIQWENRNYVLVAAGEEGILRRELPGGEWERIQVRNADPTPFRATSLSDAFSTVWVELLILFIISIIPFLIACRVIWSSNSKVSTQPLSKMQWIYLPALSTILGLFATVIIQAAIGIIFYGIFLLAQYSSYNNYIQPVLLITFVACLAVGLAALPATIYQILNKWRSLLINHNYPPQTASKLVWRPYLTHVSVFFVGTVNWILWAMGIISRYEITWISTVLSAGLVAAMFIRNIASLSKNPPPLQDAD